MPENPGGPKILLNDDFVDLRKSPEFSVSNKRSNTGLINCGLRRLVTSYNATCSSPSSRNSSPLGRKKVRKKDKPDYDPRFRRFVAPEEKADLKTQSENSLNTKQANVSKASPSTPMFHSSKTSNIEVRASKSKVESQKNKCTMTKRGSNNGRVFERDTHRLLAPTSNDKIIPGHQDYLVNQCVDPRLREKYSILKMPWKRSWTIPVFKPKTSAFNFAWKGDNFDRQTYLYDDGTEVDSTYVDEKRKLLFSKAFQNQCMALLFLGGSLCGILLVSLFIWFIFGNDLFLVFFKPRSITEGLMKQYLKYVGGSVIYVITTVFKTIGKVLCIPTNQVFQTHDPYRWPTPP